MEQRSQRTEKLLFGTLSVFLLALAFNFFTGEFRPTQSVAASDDDQSEASSPSTKSSDDKDEKSSDEESNDEPSTKSEDEESADEPSVKSSKTTAAPKPGVKSGVSNQRKEVSVDEVSTASVDEASVKSVKTEDSVVSTSNNEASDGDGDSGLGQEKSDASDGMPVAISDPNATEKVIVKNKERLFFVVPVEVESERLVDGKGNVISERKDFINWLKSIFSL